MKTVVQHSGLCLVSMEAFKQTMVVQKWRKENNLCKGIQVFNTDGPICTASKIRDKYSIIHVENILKKNAINESLKIPYYLAMS